MPVPVELYGVVVEPKQRQKRMGVIVQLSSNCPELPLESLLHFQLEHCSGSIGSTQAEAWRDRMEEYDFAPVTQAGGSAGT